MKTKNFSTKLITTDVCTYNHIKTSHITTIQLTSAHNNDPLLNDDTNTRKFTSHAAITEDVIGNKLQRNLRKYLIPTRILIKA